MKKQLPKFKKIIITTLLVALMATGYFAFLDKNIQTAEAGWWNDSWSYRKAITINHAQVTGDLENFPMLVSLTDVNLGTHAQEDGDDILFINSRGEKLKHEIESFATSTGVLVAWVKMPTLSSTVDEDIFMYYGNAGVENQQEVENVWDDNYVMVQHLEEDGTGTRYDSTSNNNDGVTVNYDGDEATTTAKINGADDFGGVDEWVEINDSDSLSFTNGEDTSLTLSAWVYFTESTAVDGNPIISKYLDNDPFLGEWHFSVGSATIGGSGENKLRAQLLDSNSTNRILFQSDDEVTLNQWSYVSFVYDGSETLVGGKLYLNAGDVTDYTEEENVYAGMSNRAGNIQIGAVLTGSSFESYSKGMIDEVRVSNVARSEYWLQTEYNNQNNPLLFISPQAEEVGPGPIGYWSFDEGYGTTAHDETASGFDGAIFGAVWKGEDECLSGKCLYFDGVNDNVLLNSTNVINNSRNVTLAAWVKLATSSLAMDIISQQGYDALSINTSNKLAGKCDGGSSADVESTATLNDNKWHYAVITGEGSSGDGVNLYLDGYLVSHSGASSYNLVDKNTRIGSFYNTGNFFHGYIDEVKIYPYARTADQIKQDYAAGLAGVGSVKSNSVIFGSENQSWMSDGLVGYWKMDEATTSAGAIDSSGNGNDGVYIGSASTTRGKYGRGGVFTDENDYVNVPSSAGDDLDFTGSFSVVFWVKPGHNSVNSHWVSKYWASSYSIGRGNVGGAVTSITFSVEGSVITGGGYTVEEWTHVVGVYNAETQVATLYDNADIVATGAADPPNGTDNSDLKFKADNSYGGNIDEVRIYNRALSEDEVKKLYEWAPGPVMHLKMDEKSGQDVFDSSGYGNSGNLVNSPTWARGKYGSALDFNGADSGADNVIISDDVLFDFYDFTYSAWINADETDGWNCIMTTDFVDTYFGIKDGYYASYTRCGSEEFHGNYTPGWHYATWVVNSDNYYIYEDGQKIGSGNGCSGFSDSINMTIGARGNDSNGFNGRIDDVKIYNYARTQKQILEDMHNGNPMKGAVLDLSFDEGYGDTVHDKSIYGNNGTVIASSSGSNTSTSSMWSLEGKVGGAMEFDGVDDYVEISNESNFDLDEEFTLSAWINPTDFDGIEQAILVKAESSGYFLNIDDDNKLSFGIHDGSYQVIVSDDEAIENEWQHVLAVSTGDMLYLYVNGEKQLNTQSFTGDMTQNNYSLLVGANPPIGDNFDRYYTGLIDEVKIYPYALNEDEIKKDYNSGVVAVLGAGSTASDGVEKSNSKDRSYCIPGDTATCDPPVLELKMDQKSGSTVFDTSGNGNDATFGSGTSTPTHTRGKFGNALRFDGVNDYVRTASSPLLDIPLGGFSGFAWIKPNSLDNGNFWELNGSGGFFADFSSSEVGCSIRDSINGFVVVPRVAIEADSFYYFGCVFDPVSDLLTMYINGIKRSSVDASDFSEFFNNGPLNIGARGNYGGISAWEGVIDQVTFFDYPRTPAQIAYDYNKGKPIAHWSFNECNGGVIHDESGNGNDGVLNLGTTGTTATGTCASSSDSFWYNGVEGKKNSGGSFDGVDDYVSISNEENFDLDESFTISSWVYYQDIDNYQSIVAKRFEGTFAYNLRIKSVTYRALSFLTTTGESTADIVFPENEWVHVAVSYDNGISKLYQNSVKVGEDFHTITSNDYNITIGRLSDNSHQFKGQIDEVKIFNYALTAEQIKIEYNGGAVRFGE